MNHSGSQQPILNSGSSADTSSPIALQPLPVIRLYFEAKTLGMLKLPDYTGSMLRGAFGHAFRRLSCMTRAKTCNGCPLLVTCPYSLIFETAANSQQVLADSVQAPKPYSIEPPPHGYQRLQQGDPFGFAMVLYGHAAQQLPLIILAWERALERGLGSDQQACKLVSVHMGNPDMPIYTPGSQIHLHPATAAANSLDWSGRQQAILHFATPLRLQRQGKVLGMRELDPRTLIVTLARRYQMLTSAWQPNAPTLDFRQIGELASQLQMETRLHWLDFERYSSRQQQTTPLGGLVGELQLTGNLEPLASLLELGQTLHIGKETTFGLGGYQLRHDWSIQPHRPNPASPANPTDPWANARTTGATA